MEQGIPVTQARADFAELVNRVVYGNERIVVTRHGRPLVALVSAADLDRLNALDAAVESDADGEGRVVRLPSRAVTPSPLADAPTPRYDIAARHDSPGRRGHLR
jgi:prevent-host-death family protein